MPAIKCLLVFRDDTGYGWTELHYRNSESSSPNLAAHLTNLVDALVPVRAPLLGEDSVIVGARVSYPRVDAIASLSKKFYVRGSADHPSTDSSTSLAVQFVGNNNTSSKIIHLRGAWDAVIENGEYHPELGFAVGWQDRINSWKDTLINGGYGWLTRDGANSRKGVVNTYLATPDQRVTFTLAEPGLVVGLVGQRINVRISRFNGGKSVLNRQLIVIPTSATSMTTVDPIATFPSDSKGAYNYRTTGFTAYTALQNIDVGRRSMGKPLGRLPGRSQVRPRG